MTIVDMTRARVDSAPPPPQMREATSALCAVAISLVVLADAGVPGLRGGQVGFDVLFVLAGFLLTRSIIDETTSTARRSMLAFWARRLGVRVPPAALVTVVTVIAARIWLPGAEASQTARDALSLPVLNFRLAATTDVPTSALHHLWLLAADLQLLAVWPVLVAVLAALARRHFRVVIATVTALGSAAFGCYSVLSTMRAGPSVPQARLFEFCLGGLVAIVLSGWRRPSVGMATVQSWVAVALAAGAVVTRTRTGWHHPLDAAAIMATCAGALWLAATTRTAPGGAIRLLARRPVQWIGSASFSWYLWHWPVIVLLPAIFDYAPTSWTRSVEACLFALWLATLTRLLVEGTALRSRLRSGATLSAVAAMVAVTVAASATVAATVPRQRIIRHIAAVTATTSTPPTEPDARLQVEAALAQGAATMTLPGSTAPSITAGPNDLPASAGACGTLNPRCVFGDRTARHTVVLFGDETAQQWQGAFIGAATGAGWRLVTIARTGCALANHTERACRTWRVRALAFVRSLHPDVVIASQNDAAHLRSATAAQWATATVTVLERLASGHARIVLLGDTPSLKHPGPQCLTNHWRDVQSCAIPRAAEFDYADGTGHGESPSLTALRRSATLVRAERAGFTIADPTQWLCTQVVCPALAGNTLIYRDTDHVTNTFSPQLAADVEPLLTLVSGPGSLDRVRSRPTTGRPAGHRDHSCRPIRRGT